MHLRNKILYGYLVLGGELMVYRDFQIIFSYIMIIRQVGDKNPGHISGMKPGHIGSMETSLK
jgi:hypothetical protein